MSKGNQYNFVLIHGAWFSPESWQPLQKEITARGHSVIVPDMPVTDINLSFKEDTDAVEDSLGNSSGLFAVAHSRGVEIIPRLAERVGVSRLVGAAILSSGGPHEIELHEEAQTRYSPAFEGAIRAGVDGLTEVEPSALKAVLLHDLSNKALKARVIETMRRQRSPADSATREPLPDMPAGLPVSVYLGTHDRVLNMDRAGKVFCQWLGKMPLYMPWGHVPQLTHPRLLTNKLISLADQAAHK